MSHPTQIFLSNPKALRVEFRLDDARLILWWSPLAGKSTDCLERNYSSRDAHLDVFSRIEIPACGLGTFLRCEYNPTHCVLHFTERVLHLALPLHRAAVMLWSNQPLTVDLSSHRFDTPLTQGASELLLRHPEPRHVFHVAALLGPGTGTLRHCPFHFPEQPVFTQAVLAAGQTLTLGVSLEDASLLDDLHALSDPGAEALLATVEHILQAQIACGRTRSARYPELAALRDSVLRGLHSMIDESGAFRASLKEIYYLLWVRDSGFSFAYQAAAGWTHKLPEVYRLLLDNPKTVTDPGLPNTRMFGQLIHRSLGKLEEDGLYYVVWLLFTHWTQQGHLDFVTPDDWDLIEEALAWVEAVTWDEDRGLFGEHFADETATHGSRDMGWDHAIGQPIADHHFQHEGHSVARNYDVYFNTCMHSAYVMLAALRNDPGSLAKAERLWPELEKLLHERRDGVPTYGELLLTDGQRLRPPYWGPPAGASCCVWGLSMPNFLPLADWDSVHAAVLDALIAKPEMHFINGINSALAAVDTWLYPEERCLALHLRLAAETAKPGKFLPMGGAMPEKFNAPQGNLYHDIRPQGFAMGSWLAAWSNLGLRRLPHGLALRPTIAFETIENYPWHGKTLQFAFGPIGRGLALEIDGQRVDGTLQVPESLLREHSHIRLVPAVERPLLLRSSVELRHVDADGSLHLHAHGLARLSFSAPPAPFRLLAPGETPIPHHAHESDSLFHIDFTHFGNASLKFIHLHGTP